MSGNWGSLKMSAVGRWGETRDPTFHFAIFHFLPRKYAKVISSKALYSCLDERGNIHFELCLQKAGVGI